MGEEKIKGDASCRGCRFAIRMESTIVGMWLAECRKNPPQIIITNVGAAIAFPQVNETMWCLSREPIKPLVIT